MTLKFEHFALNVPDPKAMAEWYARLFDMEIVVAFTEHPFTRFLADATGRVVIEIYGNTTAPLPDYRVQHPSVFHWAFAVEDLESQRDRLVAEGATALDDTTLPDGTRLIMMRDPWGVALQLCRRATPMP